MANRLKELNRKLEKSLSLKERGNIFEKIHDLILPKKEKNYDSGKRFLSYQQKGDEFYRKSLQKGLNTNSVVNYLDKARDFYRQARGFANTISEREKIKKRMNEVNNGLRIFRGSLEKTLAIFFLGAFLFSFFFLSPNMTGNVIGNLPVANSNSLGLFFFMCSIVCAFIYYVQMRK